METTFLTLRRHPGEILDAIERNESVTLSYRGKPKAVITPIATQQQSVAAKDHPAFGLWTDHDEMTDVSGYVRTLRKGRYNAL